MPTKCENCEENYASAGEDLCEDCLEKQMIEWEKEQRQIEREYWKSRL